ncbi:glycerophosphodiester phosphodiesterase [Alicyclobacillus fastidiosus]|uniref:Glycerophosphodiester phosphodiesterase n=1 Tax=Alicyclobacillus fastidiosus TaxID=392011 RepID=A0ABY6ZAZ6_9BACL|nr:glycerophosphodiester phosphodiesterase [Alicyclobacillus fastidiosus]WAH40032.1 glycerophosphodiester phosphodiesterase [Alicyclobacillus fastidiosus]GMA61333.1 glycerophosphoryl diester phosphodiesterase [Alicyclobacillus fastidiosus]
MTKSIAHRGDCYQHPENTLPAFHAAVASGADMLETDIRITRDGRAVLLHDRTLDRIWGHSKSISELTWDEICRIRLESYQIPLLEEVLDEISLPFMLDFVDKNVPEILTAILRRQSSLERFLVVTGDIPSLKRVKALLPEVKTGLTWNKRELPTDELLTSLDVDFFNPEWKFLDSTILNHMHERGLRVSCWTVDDKEHMRSLLNLGVDAITTNRLTTLVSLISKTKYSVKV